MEGEGPGVGQQADEEKEKEEEEEISSLSLLSWPRSSSKAVARSSLVFWFSAVFPSIVGLSMAGFAVLVVSLYSLRLSAGAQLLGNMDCTDQDYSLTSSFPAVAYARLVLLLFLAQCSCSLSSAPRCSASWPV